MTLIAIASHAGEDGCGSRAAATTIAAEAGKSVEQVRKDIRALRGLGLLLLGDQRLVEHLPAGRRPVVYDLPLQVKGPKPVSSSRNKSGKQKPEDPDRPSLQARGSSEARGSFDGQSRLSLEARSRGSLQATQKKTLNNPVEEPSLSVRDDDSAPSAVAVVEDRERDPEPDHHQDPQEQFAIKILHKYGVTDRAEASRLVARIELENDVHINPRGWWVRADGNGTLPACIAAARDSPTAGTAKVESVPHCGQCDERRQIVLDNGRIARCPDCHPLRSGQAA
jgi:hypothetical protein